MLLHRSCTQTNIQALTEKTYTDSAQNIASSFLMDVEELKPGLILFRRGDVQHRNWYCRIKLAGQDRYKTISLKTPDKAEARDKAFDEDAEVRFSLKHNVPIFNKSFAEVAKEFSAHQKARSEAGQITYHRWRVVDSHIRSQLNRFVGSCQISLIGQDRWGEYPIWRQQNGKGRSGGAVSAGTVRDEMGTFRSIMNYAASKRMIPESHVFRDQLPLAKVSREEFTPEEYRALHTFARSWIKKTRTPHGVWYRTMAYNFLLVMTNTGMRPSEARNLQWRDVAKRTDKEGREFISMSVRGKGKSRVLVATNNVADYLDRVRGLSKATGPNDPVFTTMDGQVAKSLYHGAIERLLIESKLLLSSSGKRRSTYCFRHTYATFRLSEGVDVLFLAHQMGTSVKMIQDHYGHITPVKNAERILQGMPGWMPAPGVEGSL
jgi:integrase